MRRLLTFRCESSALGATLDAAEGDVGLLIVTGGTQTRIGSHRIFERLARALSEVGTPCFRFDRRGVGDSEGEDSNFRGNRADIIAALSAFRAEQPQLRRVIGFGLCDGATSLALFGGEGGLDGIILVNPWFVEAEAGAPPAAAIKQRYASRLASVEGWKSLLTGGVDYRKLAGGLVAVARGSDQGLPAEVASGLKAGPRAVLVLAREDATAIAAADVWRSKALQPIAARSGEPIRIDTDSHTFAKPDDLAALLDATQEAMRRLSGGS